MNLVEKLLKIDANQIEMPKDVYTMYCAKLKEEFDFDIQAIDAEKYIKIQSDSMEFGEEGFEELKVYDMKVKILIEGCPIFRNQDVLEHFDAVTPKELIKKMLLAGEINKLSDAITKLNGVTSEKKKKKDIEEIKN